jgi:hypothetical protein
MKLGVFVLIGVVLSVSAYLAASWTLGKSAGAQVAADPVLVGAGDIARCAATGDEATANLLDNMEGTVFTTGDNAYDTGSTSNFSNCYNPGWGRHLARTKPSVGNHEYYAPVKKSSSYHENAADYFAYFGTAAGEPSKGYYSYDLGNWHIVVLNSCLEHKPAVWKATGEREKQVECVGPGPVQEQWLRDDLAAPENQSVCTLAYWHHPRFSSGNHGDNPSVATLWNTLYEAGADVVLNGHDHDYERFAPQNPQGLPDPEQGIRQFVVGTGGAAFTAFKSVKANSEKRISNTNGVLKMTLHPEGYDWQFVTAPNQAVADSGSGDCSVSRPPLPTDTTPPAVQSPQHDLPTGGKLGATTVPTKLTWSAADAEGTVVGYEVQKSVNGGAFSSVGLPSATATTKTLQLEPGNTYQFRVRATDSAGNTSEWAEEAAFLLDVQQESGAGVEYAGVWEQQALTSAYGGNLRYASVKGSSAQFTFTGQDVAWVSTKGPNMGKATVSVDGVLAKTIDLYSSTAQHRKILFSRSGLPTGSHTVMVQVSGAKQAASSGTRVDVDAFVALR